MSLAAALAWVFGTALLQTQVEYYKLRNPSDDTTNPVNMSRLCSYARQRNIGCIVDNKCYRYNSNFGGGWWYTTKEEPRCCWKEKGTGIDCEKEKTK
jgi:hypothetical protein